MDDLVSVAVPGDAVRQGSTDVCLRNVHYTIGERDISSLMCAI